MVSVAEGVIVPILVALIAAAVTVWKVTHSSRQEIRELRDENSEQHASGRQLLVHLSKQVGGIDAKIDRLDARVDGLQTWAADHEKDHLVKDEAL